jgi:predicted transposase YdaD
MSQEFDPTLKVLVETSPADWLPLLGRPAAPVTVIDADVSAVLRGAADKFLHVHADPDYVLHLDFQSGHDTAQLPPRLRLYNAVEDYRTGLPVLSAAVLLRPEADLPQLTGRLARQVPGARPHSVFRYGVVRVWRLPVGPLLAGGLGTLPLAPISDVGRSDLPRVIEQMKRRLRRQERERELWATTKILLGLRYPPGLVDVLLRGVIGMRESSTYQAILAEGHAEGRVEGRAEEAQRILLRLGERRFGPPDEATRAVIRAIGDAEKLEGLCDRLPEATSWQELLGQSAPRRRNGRRKPGR